MHDAVVIGSGPNGLVAANLLADRGWDVVVLEATDTAGGAVRSGEITAPGFRSDLYSAFYPLGAASPVFRDLELERWGLRWARSPLALAHPTPDGPSALLSMDVDETAASLDRFAAGDGAQELKGVWDDDEGERFADRMEARIERLAPGFRDRIVARHVLTPPALEASNANLVGGDIGSGTMQLSQQLVLRPVPGLGRAESPIKGLYLASASAHAGGGVHGACGANAARAALLHDRLRRT